MKVQSDKMKTQMDKIKAQRCKIQQHLKEKVEIEEMDDFRFRLELCIVGIQDEVFLTKWKTVIWSMR